MFEINSATIFSVMSNVLYNTIRHIFTNVNKRGLQVVFLKNNLLKTYKYSSMQGHNLKEV